MHLKNQNPIWKAYSPTVLAAFQMLKILTFLVGFKNTHNKKLTHSIVKVLKILYKKVLIL